MDLTRRSFLAGLGGTLGSGLICSATASAPAVASSNIIQVRAKPKAIQGTLTFAGHTYDCMVGQHGITNRQI